MLYQDKRALRVVRSAILWMGAVVTPLPIAAKIPGDVLAIGAAASTFTLLTVYLMLLWVITHRA